MKLRMVACVVFSCVIASAAQCQETFIDPETGLVLLENIQINSRVAPFEKLAIERENTDHWLREAIRQSDIERQQYNAVHSPGGSDPSQYESDRLMQLRHYSRNLGIVAGTSVGGHLGRNLLNTGWDIGKKVAIESVSSGFSSKISNASARAATYLAGSVGKTSPALGALLRKVGKSPTSAPAIGLGISVISELALAKISHKDGPKPPLEDIRQVGVTLIAGSLSAGTTAAATVASGNPVLGFSAGVATNVSMRPIIDRKTKEIGEGIGNLAWRATRWAQDE